MYLNTISWSVDKVDVNSLMVYKIKFCSVVGFWSTNYEVRLSCMSNASVLLLSYRKYSIPVSTPCLKKNCANLFFAPRLSNMNRFQ